MAYEHTKVDKKLVEALKSRLKASLPLLARDKKSPRANGRAMADCDL